MLGFVPNLLLRLSSSPPTLAAYLDLAKQVSKVGLSAIEMQTALLVAAIENGCAYCAAAHSTFATNVKIDPHVLTALREGRSTQVLLRNWRKDGSAFWNELAVAPVRASDGEVTHYIADISKAKKTFGYNPQTPFDRGIEKAVEWYKANT